QEGVLDHDHAPVLAHDPPTQGLGGHLPVEIGELGVGGRGQGCGERRGDSQVAVAHRDLGDVQVSHGLGDLVVQIAGRGFQDLPSHRDGVHLVRELEFGTSTHCGGQGTHHLAGEVHDVQAQVVGGDGSRVVDVLHVELDRRLHDRGVDQVVHHAGGGVAGLDAGDTRLGDVDDGLATVGSGHLVAGDLEYGVDQAQFVREQSHGETGDSFT